MKNSWYQNETNIVRFKLATHSQSKFIENCATDDVIKILLIEVSGGFLRIVFHNDAKGNDVELGLKKMRKVLESMK